MNPQDFLDLGMRLDAEATTRTDSADTKEQWLAVNCLRDAARYVRSAAAWLNVHDEKFVSKGVRP